MNSLVFCVFLLGVLSSTAHAYVTIDDASNETNDPDAVHFGGIVVLDGKESFSRIGDTSSCPVRPWSDAQAAAREKSVLVTFDVEFIKPPSVSAWLTVLDIDRNYNGRWIVDVSDVTTTSCVIHFKVWCNTYVYSSVVNYQALGVAA